MNPTPSDIQVEAAIDGAFSDAELAGNCLNRAQYFIRYLAKRGLQIMPIAQPVQADTLEALSRCSPLFWTSTLGGKPIEKCGVVVSKELLDRLIALAQPNGAGEREAPPTVEELEQCFSETAYLPPIVKGWAREHALGISKAIIAWQFWRQDAAIRASGKEGSCPRVNISFWGLLRDGKLYEVWRSKATCTRQKQLYSPGSKHKWTIMPVQVIYD